jgi:hypothetical protein
MKKPTALVLIALCGALTVGTALPSQAENQSEHTGNSERTANELVHDLIGAPPSREITADEFTQSPPQRVAQIDRFHKLKLEVGAIGLIVLFVGWFLVSFLSKRGKQISSAGEDAVVSILASAVKAKRKASGYRDRLKSKIAAKLDDQ